MTHILKYWYVPAIIAGLAITGYLLWPDGLTMSGIFREIIHFMTRQHPIVQGFIMCMLATGVPGPLNLIAVHKTISGEEKEAWYLLWHFAFWFSVVALLSYFTNTALLKTDFIPNTMAFFNENKVIILRISAIAAFAIGVFFFKKKTESEKDGLPEWLKYIEWMHSIPGFKWILRKLKELLAVHEKHSMKFLMVTIFVGIVFFPGNWFIFTGGYTAISKVAGPIPLSDALWTLPGVFAFGMVSWGGTIFASKVARHWIHKKSEGDPDAIERMLNHLMGILLVTLAVAFVIFSF